MKKLLLALVLVPSVALADDFSCFSLMGDSEEEAGHKIDVLHVELQLANDYDSEAQRAFIEPMCRKHPWTKFSKILKAYYADKLNKDIEEL